ncbi:MAG: hypothetical protein WCK06_04065 [Actinomycetota bacterium]
MSSDIGSPSRSSLGESVIIRRWQFLFCRREPLRARSAKQKYGLAESTRQMNIIGAREFLSEVIDVRA